MCIALLILLLVPTLAQAAETVGERPYEMVWANRNQDDHPALVDFEDLNGWQVKAKDSAATFVRTREQQIWGDYVGKLTYRSTGDTPEVSIVPPQPIKISKSFDAISCWVYGNNWGYAPNPATPPVSIQALFTGANGQEFTVDFAWVCWEEWFLCWKRLTPEQIAMAKDGATFRGFTVLNGRNKADRTIYLDDFAVFTETFPPLQFKPRPERGIPMFPGQTTGTNTGPGKLPFPTRLQTILPDNLTRDFKTTLTQEAGAYVFTYAGSDGKLTYRLPSYTRPIILSSANNATVHTPPFSDITARWAAGATIHPCVDGGVYLLGPANQPLKPTKYEPLGTTRQGDEVISRWRVNAGEVSAEVAYTFRLWNKSLVIDTVAPGGKVAEVRYGYAVGLQNPRLVTNPYYVYDPGRPAVAVSGSTASPLFLMGNTDWYLSNASSPFGTNTIDKLGVTYNGGTRYINKTDGTRNDCFERFFITLSPRFEEVLPTIPNPVSPYKNVTGTHVWRAHGAGDRAQDAKFWTNCHRWGMTEVLVTDHETGWRDGGESFTFRTRPAPKKGGDQGQYDYARLMQDKLGFVYGPYNNYTDFAPVNEFWTPDLISRTPDNQLEGAWMRCYAPKPSRAVEYCAELAPKIQEKFHFSTAYCDVHTAVAPWHRTDYDARVPGAGTFAATFYNYGEIMLHQKNAWKGPVYSEGGHHSFYCGLTDGNYGQDQGYNIPNHPWLVDFDLRKIHNLCCNFGIGNPGMFYGQEAPAGTSREAVDAYYDRFFAATVAFGHPGFLTYEGGLGNALRSYYMLQQLHSNYTLSSPAEIRYVNADGKLLETSAAVASGAYQRSQIVTRYANGTVTAANGSRTERMIVNAFGRQLNLPPNGYAGWTKDGKIDVLSSDSTGTRSDYAVTPAYLYVDGRDHFVRFPKAAGNGIGICRFLLGGKYEVLLYKDADCGFAVNATSAVALDEDNKELGPAQLRVSRGLTYVVPVKGAFSYMLTSGPAASASGPLTCNRDTVVAGERLNVQGKQAHEFTVPADAQPGTRLWQQFEGAWIDFSIVPLADTAISLSDNTLRLGLTSNLAKPTQATITVGEKSTTTNLQPRRQQTVAVDLGQPEAEAAEILPITIKADGLTQRIERGMRIANGMRPLLPAPEKFEAGMCIRGKSETPDFGTSGGFADARHCICGDVPREGIFIHPPYQTGVGYSFALLDPVKLPATPAAAFRAFVGKADGSFLGDGILFKLAVVDAAGKQTIIAEQTVTSHTWLPIEGDLSPWAGKTIRLKLISDVGPKDDSSGDWSCWGGMRIETLKPSLFRSLEDASDRYRRVPGPNPVSGLTPEDLHKAKSGRLVYEGSGLAGTGDPYGSFAVLNGVELGNMAPAGGNEVEGVFVEVSVPLNAEAISKLGMRNTFKIRNPGGDSFKVRRFRLELELADGRKASSDISTATYTQPGDWPYAEGIGVPFGTELTLDIWFHK